MITIKLRRNLSKEWTRHNIVLASGEPGVEIDTGRMKVGNGIKRWTELQYVGGTGDGVPGPEGPMGPKGETGTLRWHGDGPPGVVVGARAGDEYYDRLTGDLYLLM